MRRQIVGDCVELLDPVLEVEAVADRVVGDRVVQRGAVGAVNRDAAVVGLVDGGSADVRVGAAVALGAVRKGMGLESPISYTHTHTYPHQFIYIYVYISYIYIYIELPRVYGLAPPSPWGEKVWN